MDRIVLENDGRLSGRGVLYGRVLEMSARTGAPEVRLGRRHVEGGDPRSG